MHLVPTGGGVLRPIVLALLLSLLLPTWSPSRAAAAESCTDTAATGYVVRVCLVAPDANATLSGTVNVSARVELHSATVPVPGVNRVAFRYRDEYLVTDFDPEYAMTWRTTRRPDGLGVFEARVRLSDGTQARHSVNLTLANGISVTPANTNQFRIRTGTTPAPGQRFRVAAVGDGAAGSPDETRVARSIAGWSPNMLLYLGDVYERGSSFEFDSWYDRPDGFGQFKAITNPTIGNHEYLTSGGAGYFDYWDNVPHYYSYDVAGWHIVTIDSNPHFAQLLPGTPQYEWLAADLGANRSRCTLLYMHHPRWSLQSGSVRDGLAAVWKLLAERRVTLAIGGHAHRYERWVPMDGAGSPSGRGVTQFVAGAGGHEVKGPERADARAAAVSIEPGALRLDLGENDAQFAYVTDDGAVLDSGTIGCTSTGDPLPPTRPTGLAADPISKTSARLTWRPAQDQYTSVAGYVVRRNGVEVARVEGGATAYADTGLRSGKTYSWTVSAYDTSDNHSAQSAPAAATIPGYVGPQVSSRTLLRALPTRAESRRPVKKATFRKWLDVDGDGCTTRNEVLLGEARRPPTLRATCVFSGGRWRSIYDGVTVTDRSRLGVGHLVPIKEAWQSGARRWTVATRSRFANDLVYGPSLTVGSERVLAARGAAEPQNWLPPKKWTRCRYLAQWVSVKWRWRLSVNRGEKQFLTTRLSRCGWPRVEKPLRAAGTR